MGRERERERRVSCLDIITTHESPASRTSRKPSGRRWRPRKTRLVVANLHTASLPASFLSFRTLIHVFRGKIIYLRLGRFLEIKWTKLTLPYVNGTIILCLTVSPWRPGSRVPQVVVRGVRVVAGHGRKRVTHPGTAGKVPGARPRAVVGVPVRRVLLQLHEGLDLFTNHSSSVKFHTSLIRHFSRFPQIVNFIWNILTNFEFVKKVYTRIVIVLLLIL